MSYASLLTQTITVVRLSDMEWETDEEGNTFPLDPIELSYTGLVQQNDVTRDGSQEIRIGPDTFITDHILFLPADATVSGWDQVRVGEQVFEVIGDPNHVRGRLGVHHIEANLRRITTEGAASGS